MIIVIDYDAGNTANVLRALEKIGVTAELSADKEKILAADGLILPGVGAYPTAMAELERRGLVAVIKEAVAQGVPLLGICLGMQILTEKGLEHEETDGLGFIPGVCRPIPASKEQPVPHMGWNDLIFFPFFFSLFFHWRVFFPPLRQLCARFYRLERYFCCC